MTVTLIWCITGGERRSKENDRGDGSGEVRPKRRRNRVVEADEED